MGSAVQVIWYEYVCVIVVMFPRYSSTVPYHTLSILSQEACFLARVVITVLVRALVGVFSHLDYFGKRQNKPSSAGRPGPPPPFSAFDCVRARRHSFANPNRGFSAIKLKYSAKKFKRIKANGQIIILKYCKKFAHITICLP